jgi:hypothetical protein
MMSIRGWLAKFRLRRDAAAMEQMEAMATETREERAVASGDIAGVAADEQAARIAGQTPSGADRLGE